MHQTNTSCRKTACFLHEVLFLPRSSRNSGVFLHELADSRGSSRNRVVFLHEPSVTGCRTATSGMRWRYAVVIPDLTGDLVYLVSDGTNGQTAVTVAAVNARVSISEAEGPRVLGIDVCGRPKVTVVACHVESTAPVTRGRQEQGVSSIICGNKMSVHACSIIVVFPCGGGNPSFKYLEITLCGDVPFASHFLESHVMGCVQVSGDGTFLIIAS